MSKHRSQRTRTEQESALMRPAVGSRHDTSCGPGCPWSHSDGSRRRHPHTKVHTQGPRRVRGRHSRCPASQRFRARQRAHVDINEPVVVSETGSSPALQVAFTVRDPDGQVAPDQGNTSEAPRANNGEKEAGENEVPVEELADVDTRGGGFGRRLRRLFGIRSPSPSDEDIWSSDTAGPSNRGDRRQQIVSGNPGHRQRRRQRRRGSSGSSSVSSDAYRRRRAQLSQPPGWHSSSRHAPVARAPRERRDSNDRAGHRPRRRQHSEGGTTSHRRDAGHRVSDHGTRRTESIRISYGRGRQIQRSPAVQHVPDGESYARGQASQMVTMSPPWQRRDASPAPLSVAVPAQETVPPDHGEMSEDDLFSVILAAERATDPLLRDWDARRARGEDV